LTDEPSFAPTSSSDRHSAACPSSCNLSADSQKSPPGPLKSDFTSGDLRLTHHSFGKIWEDCSKRLPARFEYTVQCDYGCLTRPSSFRKAPESVFSDPRDVTTCQQTSANAYPSYCLNPTCGNCGTDRATCEAQCVGHHTGDPWSSLGVAEKAFLEDCETSTSFDRGHQVPANHLDHDETMIRQSNYMTNIAPQAALMNRGAWLDTEELTECWRNVEALAVFGGAVWDGNDPRRDWFKESHGAETPSAFWKVIVANTGYTISAMYGVEWIAFWIPNSENERNLGPKHVVTIAELEALLQAHGMAESFDLTTAEKTDCWRGNSSSCQVWARPEGCDLSRR